MEQQVDTGLPLGWEVRHSNSKNLPYYFNGLTKESRWEPPADTDTEKLKVYMATHHSAAVNPHGAGQGEGKIRASHLLVKHRDSRRPSSWREAEITRSKEEAYDILRAHEERIKSGEASLGDIAVSESDCSSARKKGDLYVLACAKIRMNGTNLRKTKVVSSDEARCRKSLKMLPSLFNRAR